MKRKPLFSTLVFLILLLTANTSHAFVWWTIPAKWLLKYQLRTATPEEILEKALNSNDPEKVEMCLDKFIEQKQYIYISKIKMQADNKIREVRKEILLSQTINPEVIQKELKPWVRIREKAQYFFTHRQTIQTDLKP